MVNLDIKNARIQIKVNGVSSAQESQTTADSGEACRIERLSEVRDCLLSPAVPRRVGIRKHLVLTFQLHLLS